MADGRVLYRAPYLGKTVILTAEELGRIQKLRLAEALIDFVLLAPTQILIIRSLAGKAAWTTAFGVTATLVFLAYLIHLLFKRRFMPIFERAPVSPEQLPYISLREFPGVFFRGLPAEAHRHGIKFSGFSAAMMGLYGFLRLIGADHGPKAIHPALAFLLAVFLGALFFAHRKELKRRQNDESV
jgi:hypothetical protein